MLATNEPIHALSRGWFIGMEVCQLNGYLKSIRQSVEIYIRTHQLGNFPSTPKRNAPAIPY